MPDSQILPQLSGFYKMDFAQGSYFYGRTSFWNAGQVSFVQPPAQDPDTFESLINVMPVVDGVLKTRWGYGAFGPTQSTAIRRLFLHFNDTTTTRLIWGVVPSAAPYLFALTETGAVQLASQLLPSGSQTAAQNLYGVTSRNYSYFLDGQTADRLKWDGGTGFTNWGITAAATSVSVGAAGAGSVTLNSGRSYFSVFQNSATDATSDLNPVSVSSGPVTNGSIPLSNIPVSTDPQVTHNLILATADGGDQTTLYLLATLAAGTTTYSDTTTEQTLLLNPIYQNTDTYGLPHGVADNAPPPTAAGIPLAHRGRLYILDGSALYFSKNLSDVTTANGLITGRWEECWPGTYQMNISKDAERGTALFSDGITLYIGTDRGVRRLAGSGPLDFSEPEVIFNEAGVVNQDVWKRVFREGEPVGTMWLTPDRKVMLSDFNTYEDVGGAIQDVLNTINMAAINTSYGVFAANGAIDVYLLAVPTGTATTPNTVLVFDLRRRRWIEWIIYDTTVNALLFDIPNGGNPLLLFADGSGGLWNFDPQYDLDRQGTVNQSIAVTIQSAWQHLGDPLLRKWLNWIELLASTQSINVTVEGASDIVEFNSPRQIVAGISPIADPFGMYKVQLAAYPTGDRFYRLTVNWDYQVPVSLGGWIFAAVPINRI